MAGDQTIRRQPIAGGSRYVDCTVLGRKIARLREARGLAQEDVAKSIGRAQSKISNWERGSGMPTYQDVNRLAKLFGVPTAYLCDDAIDDPADAIESGSIGLSSDERFVLSLARRVGIKATLERIIGLDHIQGDPQLNAAPPEPQAPVRVTTTPIKAAEATKSRSLPRHRMMKRRMKHKHG